jgi:hypothetical protein
MWPAIEHAATQATTVGQAAADKPLALAGPQSEYTAHIRAIQY